MCKRLGELRQAMASYAAGFDAGLLSVADARAAVAEAAAIESSGGHHQGPGRGASGQGR